MERFGRRNRRILCVENVIKRAAYKSANTAAARYGWRNGGSTAFEGPRSLLGNYKKPGRCAHGFYSSAIERRRRTAAGSSLYVRRLSGQSLPPVVSAEVEGVDPHDHGSDN